MKFTKLLVLGLASTVTASSWFSKAVYNKWHETELERWLSDHDIPYPTPADRKELEVLVKNNWQSNVVDPLTTAGDKSSDHLSNVKDWIFDTWTESSLKAFLDYHNIKSPQPRNRDTFLTAARSNYESIAKKAGEYSAYPGNWLYQSWSDSDLKAFLDTHGIPAPQPTDRDKMIASVRRNARLSGLKMKDAASSASKSATSGASVASGSASSGASVASGSASSGASVASGSLASGASVASASVSSGASVASASAASAAASLKDVLFESWSDSKLKEFLDSNHIPVPQGSKKNELVALARKYRASAFGNEASTASASGKSAYGAASSKAGNEFAKATDSASQMAEDGFNAAVSTWSESRLKAFLDARGVPVPQASKKDELLASVRLNRHKAATGWSAWTFDTWTTENLQKYLEAQGKKAKKGAAASREELVKSAQDTYATASKKGGANYASVTNYLAKQTDAAKDAVFDTWSDSDLKSYLDSYGIPNYQGTTGNELRAAVKKQATYFRYGTSTPQGTIFERVKGGFQWLLSQLQGSAESAGAQASKAATSAASAAAASTASIKADL